MLSLKKCLLGLAAIVAVFAGAERNQASAQSQSLWIEFGGMRIHDDKEGGVGTWRVRAYVEGEMGHIPLLSRDAGTGALFGFSYRIWTNYRFPLRVTIRVEEYDGGFGASWEFVGQRTMTIYRTGNYSVRLSNSEGDVTVYFSVWPSY